MRRHAITWLVTVLVAAAAWWALLGWDTEKYQDGDATAGPYSAGQVVAFVVVLAAVAAWTGIRRAPLVSSFLLAVVTTVDFSISASSSAENDGLWPVGAMYTLVGTLAGALTVSYVSAAVGERWRTSTLSASRHMRR